MKSDTTTRRPFSPGIGKLGKTQPASNTYVLKDASIVTDAKSDEDRHSPREFGLVAGTNVKLREYVGHRVEVNGHFVPDVDPSGSGERAGAARDSSRTGDAEDVQPGAGFLNTGGVPIEVTAIRSLTSGCPAR